MRNVGASCHANAILQTLLSCDQLNKCIVGSKYQSNYKNLVIHYIRQQARSKQQQINHNRNSRSVSNFDNSLMQVKREFGFIGRQQDAHDSMKKVMDCIDVRHKPSIDLFKGQNVVSVQCQECGEHSIQLEDYTELILPIIKSNTLYECVQDYYDSELITDFKCGKCGIITPHIKSVYIHKTPHYMIFVLNRFNKNLTKISKPVSYPSIIDLSDIRCVNDDRMIEYHLKGVVKHSGTTKSGHYFSYNDFDGRWYKCDDVKISNNPDPLYATNAYILLYEKK